MSRYHFLLVGCSSNEPGSLTSATGWSTILSLPSLPSNRKGPASFRGVKGPSVIGPAAKANCACDVGVIDRAPMGSLVVREPPADAMSMGCVLEDPSPFVLLGGRFSVMGDGVPKAVWLKSAARSSSVSCARVRLLFLGRTVPREASPSSLGCPSTFSSEDPLGSPFARDGGGEASSPASSHSSSSGCSTSASKSAIKRQFGQRKLGHCGLWMRFRIHL